MAIFHLGTNFAASEGNVLTFTDKFPWYECLIVMWVFFLFFHLTDHHHLSSFVSPPPFVIFCYLLASPPPYPLIGWHNLWAAPYIFPCTSALTPVCLSIHQLVLYNNLPVWRYNIGWMYNIIHRSNVIWRSNIISGVLYQSITEQVWTKNYSWSLNVY